MVLYRQMAQGYKFIQKERPPLRPPLLRVKLLRENQDS